MRSLTIKREKTFVASLMKVKVYIADPFSNELLINNTPCRQIGTLKNGEEKTFTIDENATKVFVIGDKLSKDYCNDFYNIPAGTEDIFLSGKNKYNPANGNAFRFNGMPNEEMAENRKKGTKKGLIVLLISIIVGVIIGFSISGSLFSGSKIVPKEFSSNGMTITLTNRFVETQMEGYTVCYDSKIAAVFLIKDDFSLMEGLENYTLEQYAEVVLGNSGLNSDIELQSEQGVMYVENVRTNPQTNDTYYFFTTLHKTSDAFWIVEFATPDNNIQQYHQTFLEWAKTFKVSE